MVVAERIKLQRDAEDLAIAVKSRFGGWSNWQGWGVGGNLYRVVAGPHRGGVGWELAEVRGFAMEWLRDRRCL